MSRLVETPAVVRVQGGFVRTQFEFLGLDGMTPVDAHVMILQPHAAIATGRLLISSGEDVLRRQGVNLERLRA